MNHENSTHTINWPAVIKFDGDDELIHVGDDAEWKRNAAAWLYNHTGDNLLIDSSGRKFSLDQAHDSTVRPVDTGERIDLETFVRLVRIHASSAHRCCIEKINFRNIAEGIGLVAGMIDTE